ncbi:MAG TPA: ubiquinol-cytochrome c reductase iron-sulfur subunit, partial [Gammaproteobacteria bacterium]|nr:ubiquinol-cytochrome c reductase iron-sulfur subunit [Gammaproteobacteria bacterium]
MSKNDVNMNRRHFLTVATTVAGAVGAGAIAVPFIASMQPSDRAIAAGAPVEVDLNKLETGAAMYTLWRGKSVVIVHRSKAMLARLKELEDRLLDPDSSKPQQPEYANNTYRSRKPEFWVGESVCTHLGCSPTYRPQVAPEDLGPDWPGGFFCPCHGSKFDLAGRVFENVPAQLNLVVP